MYPSTRDISIEAMLKKAGHVFTFGDDTDGQLGDGSGSGHTGSKELSGKSIKGLAYRGRRDILW